MKNRTIFSLTVAAVCSVAAFLGCETESVDSVSVTVSPSYSSLRVGGTTTLSASGGWDYQWSLSDSAAGTLSATTGSQVNYTATKTNVTQVVKVTGMASSTNSASASAEAKIVQ